MHAVKGTKIKLELPIFSGSYMNAKHVGDAHVSGIITRDTCYDVNMKHWIWFTVTESDNPAYAVGKEYKKQGKNFYPAVQSFEYAGDYKMRSEMKQNYKEAIGVNR